MEGWTFTSIAGVNSDSLGKNPTHGLVYKGHYMGVSLNGGTPNHPF